MSPRLCFVMLFLISMMSALQAEVSSFGVRENKEEMDNFVTLSESPSQIKCNEYRKNQDLCMTFNRTIDASYGEMPHIVMVSSAFLPFRAGRMDRICGGALISEKFVLTSGTCAYIVHMIMDEGEAFVRLGEVQKNFRNDEETENTTQVIKIVQIFLHPQFTAEKNNNPYNIGLLQLAKSAQFNDYVRPACLQTGEHLEDGSTLIVSDWNRGEDDTHTLRASLSVVVPYNRSKPMEPLQKHDTLTPLCVNRAGGIRSEDDGATIFQALSSLNCYYHLVGISRLDRCGTTKEPHKLLYTRLAPNIRWIEKIVWPREASLTRNPIT